METITLNYKPVGRSRRETLGGREYLVAPLSMLVPGVLNGSRGPLFYPPELVNKNPAVWNHMPIVVYHPMENGKPTSARDPYIIDKQGIGYVFRSKENGRAEGWFDVENTKRVDPRVYSALIKHQPMELSTGLFTKNRAANPNSAYKGKKYVEIVTDFTPDHLAILPDQKGACSMKDGCGMLVNKEQESLVENDEETEEDLIDNGSPNQPRDSQGRWSGGGSGGGGGASGGKGSSKSHGAASAGASSDSHETIKEMQTPGNTTQLAIDIIKKRQRELGTKQTKLGDRRSTVDIKEQQQRLREIMQRRMTKNAEGSQFGKPHNTTREKPNMAKQRKQVNNEEIEPLDDDDREVLIDSIVGNCECDTAMDKETLNQLSDELLSKLAINAMPPQLMKKKKVMVEDAESEEEMMDEEEMPMKKKPIQNQANKKTPEKKTVTVNTTKEEKPKRDPETEMLCNYALRKMQEEKDVLIEKLTANASEDDVEELTEVYNEMDVEKLELLAKALPKEEKQPVQNQRAERSERGRSNLREQPENQRNSRSFVGAGGAIPRQQAKQVNNSSRRQQEDEDPLAGPLETPTINYAEIAGYKNGTFVPRDKYAESSAN